MGSVGKRWIGGVVGAAVAGLVGSLLVAAQPASAGQPAATRDEFDSEFTSALSGYVGYAGGRVLGLQGSIGGGAGRISVNGLLEPDGTSELALGTANGLRFQQVCRLESADDGTTVERCVDRMTRAGRDFAGEPWFPAAGSPFDTTTVFRMGDLVLAAMDADIATLRRPQVTYDATGDGETSTQSMTATAGGTTLRYQATTTAEGWTLVSTRDGAETGRLTLGPADAAVGAAYPGEADLAPRFSVWTNTQSAARSARKATARTIRVPAADAPNAIYRACVTGSGPRRTVIVMGTQPDSGYHWRATSGSRSPDVRAYPNSAAGQLPACASLGAKNGPRVVVR